MKNLPWYSICPTPYSKHPFVCRTIGTKGLPSPEQGNVDDVKGGKLKKNYIVMS